MRNRFVDGNFASIKGELIYLWPAQSTLGCPAFKNDPNHNGRADS